VYFKLKNQTLIVRKAIAKAGSYRKLANLSKIPRASICGYINGSLIPEDKFNFLIKFLDIKNGDKLIAEKLQDNWKQVKGGKSCVVSQKENGTFVKNMENLHNIQAEKLRKWHRFMRENKPEEYYSLQYSRFKKISGYNHLTKRGEKVRNILEKQIADVLFDSKIDYKYEPLVNSKNRYFFPDFLINNKILIECTMWKGEAKAYKLQEKIDCLKGKYKIFVVIPKNLYRYYKMLNNHLILGLDEFVPIAQTFRLKTEGSNR